MQGNQMQSIASLYESMQKYDSFGQFALSKGFLEEPIKFLPSYKLNTMLLYYNKRPPAWTDRVFTNYKLTDTEYNSPRIYGSDHYPVYLCGKMQLSNDGLA